MNVVSFDLSEIRIVCQIKSGIRRERCLYIDPRIDLSITSLLASMSSPRYRVRLYFYMPGFLQITKAYHGCIAGDVDNTRSVLLSYMRPKYKLIFSTNRSGNSDSHLRSFCVVEANRREWDLNL